MTTQRIPVHLKKDLAWTASDPDHEFILLPKDAAILLRACNAHEWLVEALRFYAAIHSDLGSRARAALAAAEAK